MEPRADQTAEILERLRTGAAGHACAGFLTTLDPLHLADLLTGLVYDRLRRKYDAWELGRRKNHILFGAKNNVLTVIILHNMRRNILATHIGACIHVGNKADDGQRLVCIGRKSGEQITIFVQRDFFQTQSFQFFFQIPGKHHLPRSTRSNLSLFTGLSIEAYVL